MGEGPISKVRLCKVDVADTQTLLDHITIMAYVLAARHGMTPSGVLEATSETIANSGEDKIEAQLARERACQAETSSACSRT